MLLDIKHTLQKLEKYSDSSSPILSVYLSLTDTSELPADRLVRLTETILSDRQKNSVSQDIIYVHEFLKSFTTPNHARGIALFSGGNKLWEIITTPFELSDSLGITHAPYLTPLYETLDTYKRYLVLLADREKTKYFTLYLGELEDQGEFKDKSVPQKIKGRGASEKVKKVDSHIREHLHRHYKFVGKKVKEFTEKKRISGVIIGGHKEVIHSVENVLPLNLKDKVIGEVMLEPDAPMNEVLEKTRKIVRKNNIDSHRIVSHL